MRLVFWHLFHRTPLSQPIDIAAEMAAATHCRLDWAQYLALKTDSIALWNRYAEKRAKATAAGGFPPQPAQLRYRRKVTAPALADARRRQQRLDQRMAEQYLKASTALLEDYDPFPGRPSWYDPWEDPDRRRRPCRNQQDED